MKTTINTKSRRTYMTQIPSDELVTAQHDLTAKAFGLLMYYYSKGNNWDWRDDIISTDMNMTERKVKEYRKELVDKDYLLVVKGRINNIFIGRQAVMDFKGPNDE